MALLKRLKEKHKEYTTSEEEKALDKQIEEGKAEMRRRAGLPNEMEYPEPPSDFIYKSKADIEKEKALEEQIKVGKEEMARRAKEEEQAKLPPGKRPETSPAAKGAIPTPPTNVPPMGAEVGKPKGNAFTNRPELIGKPVEGKPGWTWRFWPGSDAEAEIGIRAGIWKPPGEQIKVGEAFEGVIRPGKAAEVGEAMTGIQRVQKGAAKAEKEEAAKQAEQAPTKIPTRDEFKQDYIKTYFGGIDPNKLTYEDAWAEAEKTTIPQYFEDTFGIAYEDVETLDTADLRIWNTMKAQYRKDVKDAILEQKKTQNAELTEAMKRYDETVKETRKPRESRTVVDEATGNKVYEEYNPDTASWERTNVIAEKAPVKEPKEGKEAKIEGYTEKEAHDFEIATRDQAADLTKNPTGEIPQPDLNFINRQRKARGKPLLVGTSTQDKKGNVTWKYSEQPEAKTGGQSIKDVLAKLPWEQQKAFITKLRDQFPNAIMRGDGSWFDPDTNEEIVWIP